MSDQADEMLVSGTLLICAGVPTFHDGTAHVRLEDISYADAAATIVAETTISNVSHSQGQETAIPFSLPRGPSTPAIAGGNDYAVRARVDPGRLESEGEDSLYSEQSYRVLTRGFGNSVTISLGER
jgi:uncharacterized lipoprotein YbaY